MVPAISFAATTSALSQAPAAELPAAAKVNKTATEFEAGETTELLEKITEFISNKAKEEGMKLFGGVSKELTITKMSPAGTDLAMQLQLDLSSLEDLIRSVIVVGKAPAKDIEEFEQKMKEVIPELGITTSEIMKNMIIDVNLAIDLDPTENLQIPFPGVPPISKPNIVLRAKKIKWIWPQLDKLLQAPESPLVRSEKGGVVSYKLNPEAAPTAQAFGYSPIIIMDTITDQFWLASSEEFLKIAKSGKHTLASDPSYLAATKGITTKGNSMTYVSKDFARFAIDLTEEFLLNAQENQALEIEEMLAELKSIKSGIVSIFTRDTDGLLTSTRSTKPLKEELTQAFEQLKNIYEKHPVEFQDELEVNEAPKPKKQSAKEKTKKKSKKNTKNKKNKKKK